MAFRIFPRIKRIRCACVRSNVHGRLSLMMTAQRRRSAHLCSRQRLICRRLRCRCNTHRGLTYAPGTLEQGAPLTSAPSASVIPQREHCTGRTFIDNRLGQSSMASVNTVAYQTLTPPRTCVLRLSHLRQPSFGRRTCKRNGLTSLLLCPPNRFGAPWRYDKRPSADKGGICCTLYIAVSTSQAGGRLSIFLRDPANGLTLSNTCKGGHTVKRRSDEVSTEGVKFDLPEPSCHQQQRTNLSHLHSVMMSNFLVNYDVSLPYNLGSALLRCRLDLAAPLGH